MDVCEFVCVYGVDDTIMWFLALAMYNVPYTTQEGDAYRISYVVHLSLTHISSESKYRTKI